MQNVIGIDLFSGAGGMSLGAEMAGINVKYAIEKDAYAAQTYSYNHPSTIMKNIDIRDIDTIPQELINGKSVLFGGAPCQGFSTSNRRTNNRNNSENWLYKEFIRVLNLVKPDWTVFENVTGIVEMESGVFWQGIVSDFINAGYTCTYSILNAADFGVPQRRNRLFLIGSKNGRKINLEPKANAKIVKVRDALFDLPELRNGANIDVLAYNCEPDNEYACLMRNGYKKCSGHLVSKNSKYVLERYKYISQGQNWKSIPINLMQNYSNPNRCHTGIYYRLREDDASVVIGNYRKNMIIHPWSDRGLSVREAARLQSFPDSYEFKGPLGYQQQQVGNAVPPLLAKYVFEKIIEQM
ncbi:DNA cytosine methyltransferase [Ruminococcus flavefaciens]|uniref:Cytosine-specific methyltransferase n=1 Tax=Ruminococcus flavefaciens TaxID=1265 RepID=A0A315YGT9_RUMFL|nr:DNA cytosine methyltransferase [Ruminococcus flavefaciens]PWJ10261.1 DNA (cytosine-5)-methyltransferase 1 [Ruminococcus flavefaciens]SSA52001.1 DNA (cytosine-5)-methyltransferase 1 [Ruminococcus flavefaciens]